MEFWLLVWIFYVIFVVITFIFVSYSVVKHRLIDQNNVPFSLVIIVLLSVFWPGTWLGVLYTKGKKDRKEGDENGDY